MGDLVDGHYGWRTNTITDGKGIPGKQYGTRKLDTAVRTSPSTGVRILGIPGCMSKEGGSKPQHNVPVFYYNG